LTGVRAAADAVRVRIKTST